MMPKEKKYFEDKRLDAALRSTFKKTAQTLTSWAEQGTPYLNPQEKERLYGERLRKQKTAEKTRREKIVEERVNPAASKERKAALAFRYMEESKRQDLQLAKKKRDKEFTGVPDISATLKRTKKVQYYHPGRWLKPEFQNKEMWSCCSCEVREGRGCRHKVTNAMGWQLDI